MRLLDFFLPSPEKIFVLIIVIIAANFPFMGTYHTELSSVYCLENKLTECQKSSQRDMRLNPIFWFPYILSTGNDVLAKTTGGEDELIIPLIELSREPLIFPLVMTFFFWYLAASIMVFPFEGSEERKDKEPKQILQGKGLFK